MSTFLEDEPQLSKQSVPNQQQQRDDDSSNTPIPTYLNAGKEHIGLVRKKVLGHTSFTTDLWNER